MLIVEWYFPQLGDKEEIVATPKFYDGIFELEFTDNQGNYMELKAQGEREDGMIRILYIKINGEFTLFEEPSKPIVHHISSPFTGITESDNNIYTIAIAGYFIADLEDGTHSLATSDIATQTISVVSYNKNDNAKQVMDQSTIDVMRVTISGSMITQYEIRGSAQTNGGTFDRYTATINP